MLSTPDQRSSGTSGGMFSFLSQPQSGPPSVVGSISSSDSIGGAAPMAIKPIGTLATGVSDCKLTAVSLMPTTSGASAASQVMMKQFVGLGGGVKRQAPAPPPAAVIQTRISNPSPRLAAWTCHITPLVTLP